MFEPKVMEADGSDPFPFLIMDGFQLQNVNKNENNAGRTRLQPPDLQSFSREPFVRIRVYQTLLGESDFFHPLIYTPISSAGSFGMG